MQNSKFLKVAVAAIVVLLGVIAYKLFWTAVEPKIEHRISEIGLTENEKAANGPLSGDVSLYQKELRCCEELATPGYFPSLNGAELADAQRGGSSPSRTGLNRWRSTPWPRPVSAGEYISRRSRAS